MRLNRRRLLRNTGLAALALPLAGQRKSAPTTPPAGPAAAASADCHCSIAADGTPLDTSLSELRPVIERYEVELRDLGRVYPIQGSTLRREKYEKFYTGQFALLESISFDALSQPGRVDYLLLRSRLRGEQAALADQSREDAEIEAIVPFQQTVIEFEEARRRMDSVDPQKSALALQKMIAYINDSKAALNSRSASPILNRAALRLVQLRNTLRTWYNFYDLYDPKFSWWVDSIYKSADEALDQHAQFLHTKSGVSGALDTSTGFGGPGGGGGGGGRGGRGGGGNAGPATDSGGGRGRAGSTEGKPLGSEAELSGVGAAGEKALIEALRAAMIPYTPDELIALANKEFAWCDREMLRASGELGFGNDWKKAVDAVKNKYVEPGQMIGLVRDLSREAIAFVEQHELVTIPDQLKHDYWEEAMTPQAQLSNPFFLGGTTIQVSSPASSQTLDQRLESMRGNNIYFARATVFHELVPGHHMQGYMQARFRTYRGIFSTPFWTEGMAFYWEMLMWDLGFTHTPEQRIGALVWRMHRCARIIFSLSFHLGKMKALECVQFLMDRVGFDHANAEGEVRRSFAGGYAPIYQCAYMLGALQFYALHKELVGSGKMTNRAFHDAIYREGNMPVEMVRLAVNGQRVTRDYETSWKFYGSLA